MLKPARPADLFRIFTPAAVLILGLYAQPLKSSAQADYEITASQLKHFETLVRPALTEYCLDCHASDTEASGGLLLDSKQGWERGGDSGTAVVPGEPNASRLLRAIRYDEPKLQMPPDKKLPAEVVSAFETWIAKGAIDPRTQNATSAASRDVASRVDARDYWSYQPISVAEVPISPGNPNAAPIDCYINQRLELADIRPTALAERYDQVRRLHFDLTGLPPSANLVQKLHGAEDFEAAYRTLVDHLLSSPHYGEAFARRWMDVARYAESVTLRGLIFKEAWRYRDYLVKAYAQDRPFDQMIREQIVGDLLHAEDATERQMQLVATAFLAMGDTNFEKQDKGQLDMDYVDEQLDLIGQAFLGQTMGCARCHDHKFDPIPTRDYYALAGILKSAVPMRHANVSSWIDRPLPLPQADEQRHVQWETDLQQLNKELAAKKKSVAAKTSSPTQATTGTTTPDGVQIADIDRLQETEKKSEADALADEIELLEARKLQLQQQVDSRPKYLTVVEETPGQDLPIHIRGDIYNLGQVVPRGFLTAIQLGPSVTIAEGSSGRLELAEWLSSADNPLTARVYANRVWTWLMGQGLVDSVNNFGTTGSMPSHPELLDWLANELIENNWSTKHLVRSIVLSDAYRRRVTPPSDAVWQRDPDNRLYWRAQQRRLSVEELRDAMLEASGELDLTQGGTLIKAATNSDYNYGHITTRRSIYHPVFRNSLPELFSAFDYPESSLSTGLRSRSTVATQALALQNDSWVHQRARAMAVRISSEFSQTEPSLWIRSAYQHCFQRQPSAGELKICLDFFGSPESGQYPEQLELLTHSLLASIDFRYLR